MGTYKTRRAKENRLKVKTKAEALKNADEFAKMTFIALRKDDSCFRRFLRFFKIIPPQRID